jgi:hypothetical protein
MSVRGARVELTHDRLDFRHNSLELPGCALELIPHSLAQRGNAGLQALHLPQYFVDRIESFFQSVFRRHVITWFHNIARRYAMPRGTVLSPGPGREARRVLRAFAGKAILHRKGLALRSFASLKPSMSGIEQTRRYRPV